MPSDYLKKLIEKAKKSREEGAVEESPSAVPPKAGSAPKLPPADAAVPAIPSSGIPPSPSGEGEPKPTPAKAIKAKPPPKKGDLGDLTESLKALKREDAATSEAGASPEQALEELEGPPSVPPAPSAKEVGGFSEEARRAALHEAISGVPPEPEVEEPESPPMDKEPDAKGKIEVDHYGDVKIYKLPGHPLLYYFVPVPRPTQNEKRIINTIKEAATRLITIAPFKIRDPDQRRAVYRQRILDILKSSPEIRIPKGKFSFYTNAVVREMVGYGLIDTLVADDKLEEIMIIGAGLPVYVFHREYEMMTTNIEFYSNDEINDIVNRIAREVGRRVDISNPLMDARLPDGSRVNATISPASISGSTLTIRKFRKDPFSIVDLVNYNTVSTEVAAFLWLAVEGMNTRPANVLISGGTGSGKTTLLNVLASFVPDLERVITIEDTAELNLPLKHWIRMESRPPGLEGKGEITMDVLTKNSLRMRPDRIIVGEIRHDEAFTLFTAMNTGHDGCLTHDVKLPFTDGVESIGEFVDREISVSKNTVQDKEWEAVDVQDKHVNALNDQGRMVKAPVVKALRREYQGKVRHIKLASGAEITVTPNHPFFTLGERIEQKTAGALEENQFVATPRTLLRDQEAQEKETEYWSGLLYGDGNLFEKTRMRKRNGTEYLCRDANMSLYTEEKSVVPAFENFLKENFEDTHVGISERYNGTCYKVQMSGVEKTKKAKQLFGIPSGSRLTGAVQNSHYQNALQSFVAGFFDAEGYVDVENKALVFTCANEEYIDFIRYALLTQGIRSRKYESKSHNSRWYRVYVYGIDQVKRFAQAFPIRYPAKRAKLEKLLKQKTSSNTNIDLIPCTSLVKEKVLEAKKKGISEREIGRKAGISQGMMRFLRLGERLPSREMLEKLVQGLEKCGLKARRLQALVSADIFWDRIVAVHEFEYNGFVYDLTVGHEHRKDMPHNFVAEGILVGNSLGSVHANSAQETLVRVTNPPMNVPPTMLSGLDIIIIEQRIHDRKKGTIRRVTEIGEVTGVLEGKPQTQTLFERDAGKDLLVKTGVPSEYIKLLKRFSGLSQAEIDEELKRRERFLKKLVKEDIKDIAETSTQMKSFLLQGGE